MQPGLGISAVDLCCFNRHFQDQGSSISRGWMWLSGATPAHRGPSPHSELPSGASAHLGFEKRSSSAAPQTGGWPSNSYKLMAIPFHLALHRPSRSQKLSGEVPVDERNPQASLAVLTPLWLAVLSRRTSSNDRNVLCLCSSTGCLWSLWLQGSTLWNCPFSLEFIKCKWPPVVAAPCPPPLLDRTVQSHHPSSALFQIPRLNPGPPHPSSLCTY